MFVLSLGGFIYFIFFIYYITFLAAVLYIDVHAWKSQGGGGRGGVVQIFAQNAGRGQCFSDITDRGFLFSGSIAFLFTSFFAICLSPMFPLSPTYLPCVYLWLAIYGWNLSVFVAYYLSKLTHCFEMNLSAEKMKTLPSSIAHKIWM